MRQILEQVLDKTIEEKEFKFSFEIKEDGIYGIEILASAKSWQQNLLKSFFKDDDLTVTIDEISFSKISRKRGFFDSEVAWNGNNLKGLKKTDLFIIKFQKGAHTLKFLTDQSPK